jgi:hypothetical protein
LLPLSGRKQLQQSSKNFPKAENSRKTLFRGEMSPLPPNATTNPCPQERIPKSKRPQGNVMKRHKKGKQNIIDLVTLILLVAIHCQDGKQR